MDASAAAALDRPIWAALTTAQTHFALGGDLARRFDPMIEPFVAAQDDAPASLAALGELVEPGEEVVLLQAATSSVAPGLAEHSRRDAVQMIAQRAPPASLPPGAVQLGEADAAEMQALAVLTAPGPFKAETWRLGGFWGLREDGRLVAMAGERLRFPGWTELSGVCVHPDARGRGLGRAFSAWKLAEIAGRGERVFLHAYADNHPAIRLYEQLGFTHRRAMVAKVLALAPAGSRS